VFLQGFLHEMLRLGLIVKLMYSYIHIYNEQITVQIGMLKC